MSILDVTFLPRDPETIGAIIQLEHQPPTKRLAGRGTIMADSYWQTLVVNGAVRTGVAVPHGHSQVSVTGLSVVGEGHDWSHVITALIDAGEQAEAMREIRQNLAAMARAATSGQPHCPMCNGVDVDNSGSQDDAGNWTLLCMAAGCGAEWTP